MTISHLNGCGYCMSAHSMLAAKVCQVPADVLEAIRAGKAIPDERLAGLRVAENTGIRHTGADFYSFLE